MLHLMTWIREQDEPVFLRWFQGHPEILVHNARRQPADPADRRWRGLLLTGGPDVSAAFHVEEPRDSSLIREPEPARDAWEIAAVRTAAERDLPLFCICKGLQLLNVAFGGTLQLDIPGHDLPEMKHANVQPLRHDARARHRFERVNSSHHQALDRVADVLEVEAWHAGDGIIEQARLRDHPWGLGVQYHPERDSVYAPLFADFFEQLKSHEDHSEAESAARHHHPAGARVNL
ncbi:MAG: gamma-glutamyl-gamma-aminobutyrate hydrolase family protein [Verrucomicrobiota bacterium]|nr:gamma-glutamyl-gamma-aminobutyrate hydrolase family protein [Verrucomicrobiota bacterium]